MKDFIIFFIGFCMIIFLFATGLVVNMNIEDILIDENCPSFLATVISIWIWIGVGAFMASVAKKMMEYLMPDDQFKDL